jgi:hypothetical protein
VEGNAAAGWSRRANRITSPLRAVGGRLFVDERGLRFEPHAFDRALAARGWSVGFDEVSSVEVAGRRPFRHLFGAGLRRQLCVEANGGRTYFIVNGVEQVVAELRALMSTP